MARFIDADKAMEEATRIGGHNLCDWSTLGVKALIDRQPTADVVPKAEYDAAIIDRNAARLGMIAEHERLKQAKTEAIKEFAVCLNEKLFSIPTAYNSYFGRMIDATIKEMTEGEG